METKVKPQLDLRSLSHSFGTITKPIAKHMTFLLIIASAGILIYAILVVQTIITPQDDTDYRQQQQSSRINGSFDQETIDKINNLRASSESSTVELPAGRRNPFIN